MAPWGRIGLGAWALAQLAWIFGAGFESDAIVLAGFGVSGLGLGLAAITRREDRPGRWTLGIALSLAGVSPFFIQAFSTISLDGYFVASLAYILGTVLLLVAGVTTARDGPPTMAKNMVRSGAALAFVASLVWTPLDGFASSWVFGNVLTGIGALLVAIFPTE